MGASAFALPPSSKWSSALVTVMIITGAVEPSSLPAASPATLSGQEEGYGSERRGPLAHTAGRCSAGFGSQAV